MLPLMTKSVDWQVPLSKIPGLRWTSANAVYNADYKWDSGTDPLEAETEDGEKYTINRGHTINNLGVLTLNGNLNFERVYKNVPYFKTVMGRFGKDGRKNASKEKREVVYQKGNLRFFKNKERNIVHSLGTTEVEIEVLDSDGKKIDGDIQIVDKNKVKFTASDDYANCTVKVVGKKPVKDSPLLVASDYALMSLFSIRNASISYKNQRANTTTGYLSGTKILGMQNYAGAVAPGLEYIMALNGDEFHYRASEKSWLVKDSTLMDPILYTRGNNIGVRLTVEPINTFRIDVNFDRTMLFNTEDYFYWTGGETWETTSKVKTGNYRTTFNMIKTAFKKVGDDYSLETYTKFLESRPIVADRQAAERASRTPLYTPEKNEDGMPDGYSLTHQDVLLPAFLAAYSGINPEKISLNPFLKMPLPNWRVNYKGLGNISFLKDYVRSALLTHSYICTYSVSNFKNNANYSFEQEEEYGQSFVRYEVNDLFIPQYEIGSVTLEERFAPLFGMDISWVNMLSTKFEYRRTRLMTLSFANSQITEAYKKEWVIGLGYKFAQLPLNIRTSSGSKRLKSDLDLRTDFVINDDKTILREIEDMYNEISAGQRSYSIRTTADYQLSQRLKLQLYYNHNIANPLISTSYRTSNIKFGFTLTMGLD